MGGGARGVVGGVRGSRSGKVEVFIVR